MTSDIERQRIKKNIYIYKRNPEAYVLYIDT